VRQWLNDLRDWYLSSRYGAIDPRASLGTRGEQAAARLLRQKGFRILAQSERDRLGEIDLIAVAPRQRTVVFIEVKTLASHKPGHPAERVDVNKQRRLTQAAMRYLKRKRLLGVPSRFDVVAVWWPSDQPVPQRIEHYEAAFEAQGEYQWFA
jgi:putative endonuclease